MNILQLKDALRVGYSKNRPILILGSPGLGKSDCVRQFAKSVLHKYKEDVGVIEVRGASLNPGELADISYVIDGLVKSAPQDWVPTDEKVAAGVCPPRGIIFLDELGDAMMSIQSSLQRLLLDRKLGTVTLAKGWYCVAASNRAKDKAAAGRISSALINRCWVVNVDADPDVFFDWGLENGVDPRLLAYVRWVPSCVNDFDPTRRTENQAFCSPRSLHIASDLLAAEPPQGLLPELLFGTLGDGIGSEVLGFLNIIDSLPDLEKIIRNPETAEVPEKTDVIYATIGALNAKLSEETYENILTYFTRFPTELSIVAVKDAGNMCATKLKLNVFGVPAVSQWSSDKIKFSQ